MDIEPVRSRSGQSGQRDCNGDLAGVPYPKETRGAFAPAGRGGPPWFRCLVPVGRDSDALRGRPWAEGFDASGVDCRYDGDLVALELRLERASYRCGGLDALGDDAPVGRGRITPDH